jgi:predicted nuclease with TOPRIM domain
LLFLLKVSQRIKVRADDKSTSRVSYLSEQIDDLNLCLTKLQGKVTDKRTKIQEQITKIDMQIDEIMYRLYDINEDERRLIEETSRPDAYFPIVEFFFLWSCLTNSAISTNSKYLSEKETNFSVVYFFL